MMCCERGISVVSGRECTVVKKGQNLLEHKAGRRGWPLVAPVIFKVFILTVLEYKSNV